MNDPWIDRLVQNHFRLLMGFVLLLGINLLLVSQISRLPALWQELIRDIGIATVVSFCVTVIIEYYSAKRREADIRSGVLDSILGKIVHPSLWDEIKSILVRPAVCEAWHLEAELVAEDVKLDSGPREGHEWYVLNGTLSYKLANSSNETQVVSITHELEDRARGRDEHDVDLPEFTRFAYSTSAGKTKEFSGRELKSERCWTDNALTIPVTIPGGTPSGKVEIEIGRREILGVPCGYPWYMSWVVVEPAITLKTKVESVSFEVIARHPNPKLLRPVVAGEKWVFGGVMLPGQGFEITCRKAVGATHSAEVVAKAK